VRFLTRFAERGLAARVEVRLCWLGPQLDSVRNKLLDDGRSREDSEILVRSCTTAGGDMQTVTSAPCATWARDHDPNDSNGAALAWAAVHSARDEWTTRS